MFFFACKPVINRRGIDELQSIENEKKNQSLYNGQKPCNNNTLHFFREGLNANLLISKAIVMH